ncbi:bifunctional lysylphosphatidylglycerol flippase/synthetase MprF [Luteibacter flocculans]|uniref:Bifunctional lysylphosphatidylglycerol flippase/synthetase MprF n=1 Tax=Luteibacter flocculans TaxID=2780091 RepID=A0ABY4T3G0_9GAMM|nr:bifunctional lysylphosphatidylglycerol flippase/synthetase MprF [Luteibacter flocculans]URL58647.1 bifunctional lysylphosphatidylglycerol flippase/synthetase MprF [Luteibacter flocculans]
MEHETRTELPSTDQTQARRALHIALLRRAGGPLLSAVLLCLALWALHAMASEVTYRQIAGYVHTLPNTDIGLAVLLTGAGYAVMTLYDWFGLASIGRRLPPRRVGLISFISYAFSNALGMSLLISGSIRYRFYVQAGLSTGEIGRVVLYTTMSFWLGLAALTGCTLLLVPIPPDVPLSGLRIPLAIVLVLVPLAWFAVSLTVRRPLRVWRWNVSAPTPIVAARQILVGALDWGLAAGVLYVLMPEAIAGGFGHFLAIFVVAQMAGLISHVPGGLGVFEAVMLAGFGATGNQGLEAPILGSLAAYRLVYYLLPLCVATVMVIWREVRALRHAAMVSPWFSSLLPPFFAGLTLVCGAVLLFSGATLAIPGRMEILRGFVPLPLVEVSHFLSSVVGMLLLILARGLQRRLDAAYVLTLVLLILGAIFSLLKGIDYEEATLLSLLALALAPAHRYFHRRASLFRASFSPGWMLAIGAVLACSTWLVFFSFKHVEYSNNLWWEFSFHHGGAPRALRALVGATAVVMLVALANLIRPARPRRAMPGEAEFARAMPLIKQFDSAQAHLALVGDKMLMFAPGDSAFIMYDIEGRSWVAMGDPVGKDEEARRELVWTFRENCERAGGWPLFYQVRPQDLDLYLDVGMNLLKIGEEARVRLDQFNLDGKSKKTLRGTVNKLSRDGLRMEIVPIEGVPALLPRLKAISDAWMRDKKVREKRFSLGLFDERYLCRTPMAVVWQGEEPVAFANVFVTETKEEASVDLMRHLPEGPSGIMDFLFIELMVWAKAEGYRWFNLGMAPLSGLQNRRTAPLWSRFGAMVFGRGERFYNFRGLHRYKDKFDPEWEPRYIAVPGGIALPLALANVASLISGGLGGVVRR